MSRKHFGTGLRGFRSSVPSVICRFCHKQWADPNSREIGACALCDSFIAQINRVKRKNLIIVAGVAYAAGTSNVFNKLERFRVSKGGKVTTMMLRKVADIPVHFAKHLPDNADFIFDAPMLRTTGARS